MTCASRGCTWQAAHTHPRHHVDRTDVVVAVVILTSLAALTCGVISLRTP